MRIISKYSVSPRKALRTAREGGACGYVRLLVSSQVARPAAGAGAGAAVTAAAATAADAATSV